MVKVNMDLEIKCDKCGKQIFNHYPIEDLDTNIDVETDKLAELNDFTLSDDGKDYCPDCQ